MGEALIAALIGKKVFKASEIGLHEPDPVRLKSLRKKYPVLDFPSNAQLAAHASTILLAVKPQQMKEVLREIRPVVTKKHLLLSIAAGLDTNYYAQKLSRGIRLIRIMPNMASLIGEGAAGLYAGRQATPGDRTLALRIFSAAGQALFVEREELLDVVTAVSGSGPAFVYLFIDALIEAGGARGLARELGQQLVLQTLIGSVKMVAASKEPIPAMIQRVASKGGTTEAGLRVLEENHFREMIRKTIEAAADRARELRCMF